MAETVKETAFSDQNHSPALEMSLQIHLNPSLEKLKKMKIAKETSSSDPKQPILLVMHLGSSPNFSPVTKMVKTATKTTAHLDPKPRLCFSTFYLVERQVGITKQKLHFDGKHWTSVAAMQPESSPEFSPAMKKSATMSAMTQEWSSH